MPLPLILLFAAALFVSALALVIEVYFYENPRFVTAAGGTPIARSQIAMKWAMRRSAMKSLLLDPRMIAVAIACSLAATAPSLAQASLLSFNGDESNSATVRADWLAAIGISSPMNLVDFETGFADNQNVHAVGGLFPDGLVIRDSAEGEAFICCGIGENIGGTDPDGLFAVTQNEDPYLELDFSQAPVDYVSFQGIDHGNMVGVVTFLGGATEAISIDRSINDGGEFFGIYRNDMPPIIKVELPGGGGTLWGIDNIEYGVIPAVPALAPLAIATLLSLLGVAGFRRLRA